LKRILLLAGILLLLSGSFRVSLALSEGETQVFEALRSLGFDEAYVAVREDSLVMRIEDPGFEILDTLHEVFVAAGEAQDLPTYVLEIYHEKEPLYSFTVSHEAVEAYASGTLSEEAFNQAVAGESALSLERAIVLDVGVFDGLVYQVDLSEKEATLGMKYTGSLEEELVMDLPNMALRVLFHAPWVETVTFIIDHHTEPRAIEIAFETGDLLEVLEGGLSLEALYERAEISEGDSVPLLGRLSAGLKASGHLWTP